MASGLVEQWMSFILSFSPTKPNKSLYNLLTESCCVKSVLKKSLRGTSSPHANSLSMQKLLIDRMRTFSAPVAILFAVGIATWMEPHLIWIKSFVQQLNITTNRLIESDSIIIRKQFVCLIFCGFRLNKLMVLKALLTVSSLCWQFSSRFLGKRNTYTHML